MTRIAVFARANKWNLYKYAFVIGTFKYVRKFIYAATCNRRKTVKIDEIVGWLMSL